MNLHSIQGFVGQRFEFCNELYSVCFPLIKDSMHLFSFDFISRSQCDLEVGQSEARNCLSHLEHQLWLAIHHFIHRALIGSSFRDRLPTLLLQWRSAVRNDRLQSVTVFT